MENGPWEHEIRCRTCEHELAVRPGLHNGGVCPHCGAIDYECKQVARRKVYTPQPPRPWWKRKKLKKPGFEWEYKE